MSKFLRGAFLLTLFFFCATLPTTSFAARPDVRARLQELGAVPCPNSAFTCVTLTVPLDHFNPQDPRTLDVVFAILPASGARKGMFVTATGGPGTSGIYYADDYTSYLAPEIPEQFDIVFFDQRGIGLSGGLTCPEAAARWYRADWRADTPTRQARLETAAQNFSAECDNAMNQPEMLPYLGTMQAVQDLDMFRALLGDDKLWIYGESYGTQYAQTYAHLFGDRVAGMILDGTVDLTPDGITYYARAVQAFNNTLIATLRACGAEPACARDFGSKPLRVYDRLTNELRVQRKRVFLPLGDGTRAPRALRWSDWKNVGIGQMYGVGGRMMFARALAKYARDNDLSAVLRLYYLNAGIDSNTLALVPDASWSDAMYYAVECQDYGYFQGSVSERAEQFIHAAKATETSKLRLSSLIWGDLPCVYWRASSQDVTRPPHWNAAGIPTLVLNADLDPITPIGSARAVYEHLDDGYLITQRGGPHVIWGRGNACIDDMVNAFLLDDAKPAQRETECNGRVMANYVPLAPRDAREFGSMRAAMQSAETEINYLPEFWYWDYVTTTRVGCTLNGWLRFKAVANRAEFTLNDCAFSEGWRMTGSGRYQFGRDRFVLEVQVTGHQNCALVYERKREWVSVTGTCDGAGVNEQRILSAQERFEPKERLKSLLR